jgi:hypothetical protein
VVDDGRNQGAQIGPVQNRQQYDKVLELIADAKRAGRVVAGGDPIDRQGYFIAPTIIRDLPDDSRLVREEQFGPVFPVLAYDDLDAVIDPATSSAWAERSGRAIPSAGSPLPCDRFRPGVGQQAPRHALRHTVRRRETVRHRTRAGD